MQQFHITVLQSLVVTAGGGAIEVPAGYFGRGLCVIVYSSPSLTSVLTTRRIYATPTSTSSTISASAAMNSGRVLSDSVRRRLSPRSRANACASTSRS